VVAARAEPQPGGLLTAPRFAVNVLAERRSSCRGRFASAAEGRFADGAWALGEHGAPVLAGCAAVFECETVSQQVVGDHACSSAACLACSESPLPAAGLPGRAPTAARRDPVEPGASAAATAAGSAIEERSMHVGKTPAR